MRDYTLDTQAARQATAGGQRISESGAYSGVIVAAWYEQKPTGSECVVIQFKAENGQTAGPLSVYTHGKTGEPLGGLNMVNAILTCAKVRNISAKPGKVTLYDYDSKQDVEKTKQVFPELAGKPMGLLLQNEEFKATQGERSGEIMTRLTIFGCYEPSTKRMAPEVLDQSPAKLLEAKTKYLEANPVRKAKGAKVTSHGIIDEEYDRRADASIPFDEVPF